MPIKDLNGVSCSNTAKQDAVNSRLTSLALLPQNLFFFCVHLLFKIGAN